MVCLPMGKNHWLQEETAFDLPVFHRTSYVIFTETTKTVLTIVGYLVYIRETEGAFQR